MQDLEIAYYLVVILIGFAALSITGFWTFKTKDTDLRNFSILYALFTLVLIVTVLRQYLSLNVEGYTAGAWYQISGVNQVLNCAVIVALIHFLAGIYAISAHRHTTYISILTLLVSVGLIYSPIGATMTTDQKNIHFGNGYKLAIGWYFLAFTYAIGMGYGFLKRVWQTNRRNLVLGSLIFATVGYLESLLSLPTVLQIKTVTFEQESGFLFSSIPYALYGLFLISHFLHFSLPTPIGLGQISASFISAYNITDREREIIQKVLEGKSNADIAGELVISLATVKTHLHNIYQKVGVDSRFDLLARVRSSQ